VRVSVRWTDKRLHGLPAVETAVHDNGPGFTPEQANQAFEVFYTSKSNGTGLGLPIANRIVEAHGGKMRPVTGGSDGATILFTLPRGTRR
jgi:signal transduction histidine kinase